MLVIKMIKRITGLTQDALANFLGVSRASVNSWENSETEMTTYQKRIISDKFMIPMKYLDYDLVNNFEMCKKVYTLIQNNWNNININKNMSKEDQILNWIEGDLKSNSQNTNLSDYDIIDALSDGFNPYTGEVYEQNHILNDKRIKEFLNRIKNKYFKFEVGNKTYDDLSEKEKDLFEEFRKWRRDMTFKEGFFSAYMVLTDKELVNIITANIKKKEDLLRIKGIGEIKYNKYGDELYNILRHSCLYN